MKIDIEKKIYTALVDVDKKISPEDISLDIPNKKFNDWDYSLSFIFKQSKSNNVSPQKYFESIEESLHSVEEIKDIEFSPPGFLNIRLHEYVWVNTLNKTDSVDFIPDIGDGKKVQVEFISANPTGPTTIGNARGGYIGDTLAAVLQSSGYDTTREYYFNDAGTQIDKLVESVKVAAGLTETDDRQYSGEYIENLATKFKDELQQSEDAAVKKLITEEVINTQIKPAIKKMGIEFDVWTNERDLIEDGKLQEVLDIMRSKDMLTEKDEALFVALNDSPSGREERVLIKSSGAPTYLAPDLAYHYDIFKNRGFDQSIKQFGSDHVDQFPDLKNILSKILGFEPDLRLSQHQWFRLIKDGKEVKVSKRAGNIVTIAELLDEVEPDVARFMTLTTSSTSPIDFDFELAKEQSKKNPYWYVMYAYARLNSILANSQDSSHTPAKTINTLTVEEIKIFKLQLELPSLVEHITKTFEVHKLIHFAADYANLVHHYYETVPALKDSNPEDRLTFIAQVVEFFEILFKLINIKPIKSM